ncbi:DUF3142 domain-containing protein [Asaia sp. As-1742]|uniref:DUF3142 domain-containing protein n=1 Tax=Asaia sp. As-1742 TaxID=2608325 RepID=UPI00142351D5
MPRWRTALAGAFIPLAALTAIVGLFLVRSAAPKPVQLPSDAYIWQRQWRDELLRSITQAAPSIQTWHILAAEFDQAGQWHDTALLSSRQVLASHRVIAVFRLSGRIEALDPVQTGQHIEQVLARWQTLGLTPEGIEIDHDCPTARLGDYATWLDALHRRLSGRYRLTITALPSWIGAPALGSVLSHVESVVLQLHAVSNPAGGLFRAHEAQRDAAGFGRISPVPWQIALPSYGTKIIWGEAGQPVAVESEMARGIARGAGQELTVAPEEVAQFMERIEHAPPAGLAGWIWFRLPVAGDRRAWSLPAWLTLVRHEPLRRALSLGLNPQGAALYHIVLRNDGTIDATLPLIIHADKGCAGMGAQGPYRLDYDQAGPVLVRTGEALLPVGQEIVAGWLTCQKKKDQINVSAQDVTPRF